VLNNVYYAESAIRSVE